MHLLGVPKKRTLFDERGHNLGFGSAAVPVRYIFFEISLFENGE